MNNKEKAIITLTCAALLAALIFYGKLVALGLPAGLLIAGLVMLAGAAVLLAEVER